MPTYDYECQSCNVTFEFFHPISQAPYKTCPECKKDSLMRLISQGAGVVFKGSGFFVTDNKVENKQKPKTPNSSNDTNTPNETSKADSSSTSKSDSATSSEQNKTKQTKDKNNSMSPHKNSNNTPST